MSDNRTHPLWTPCRIGAHTLQSRLVLPPMASGTADEVGRVTDATLRHYARIVTPRHGLAFVEYTYVHPSGRSEPNQTSLSTDEHVLGLAKLAQLMRSRGVLPGIQLTHAGGKTTADLIGSSPVGASALPIPAYGGDFPAPTPLTEEDLEQLSRAFVLAAVRAEQAGFAVIEIHAAHGYFWNQWLSPLTNQRNDRHGGTLEARSQLLLGVISDLRDRLRSETLLSLRFAGQDRLPGGLELADSIRLAHLVRRAGVDVLNVSSGLGGWRRGRDQRGEGYLVEDAAILRREVGLPVIGVGGIMTFDYCRDVLDHGPVDLLAVGRAVLENPAWPMGA